jgi:hypothetical protein
VQDEIDRLEEGGGSTNEALGALWARKKALLQRIEELK